MLHASFTATPRQGKQVKEIMEKIYISLFYAKPFQGLTYHYFQTSAQHDRYQIELCKNRDS
ncbi:MAG: hypothetical protein PVG39_25300, partial [Desulfobacteraceae bacterium]